MNALILSMQAHIMRLVALAVMISKTVSKWRRWIFHSSLRLTEFINSFALMGFSTVMIFGYPSLVLIHPFRKFTYASNPHFWFFIFSVGLLQASLMFIKSCKSKQASGILLHISSLIWAVLAITVGLDHPPVSTALPIYSLLSLITICAGHDAIKKGKRIEAQIRKGV